MHQQIQTFLSENMIILLYSRYDELKLLIILAFYQPPTKQLIIASRTQQLGWRKLPDIWINRVALRWISAISLRTFQFFNGYFLRVNPQVKQFSPNSYSVWWALQITISLLNFLIYKVKIQHSLLGAGLDRYSCHLCRFFQLYQKEPLVQ